MTLVGIIGISLAFIRHISIIYCLPEPWIDDTGINLMAGAKIYPSVQKASPT